MALQKRTAIRSGGGWAVWRGQDAGTGRLALVKAFAGAGPDRAAAARRLADEVEFLAGFDHPNVLRPGQFDADATAATFGDAQCSLANYLAWAGPLVPAQVANVLVDAASGLEHLHTRRRGHGCVTLDALLVGPAGEVLLGDFLGAPLGGSPPAPDPEPRYLAPELLSSSAGRWGAAADLYGLGFAALELLAGPRFERLFALPPGSKWLSWHADTSKELSDWRGALPHVPTGLLDIINGLIAKKPAARLFPTAAQLRAAVQRSGLTSGQRLAPYEGTSPAGRRVPRTRRVGPFDVRKVVHRGSRSAVYLGRWLTRDGREAAVRVFPPALATDARGVRALLSYLNGPGRVASPYLAEVFRAGAVSTARGMRWYAAEQFVRGGSLRERLKGGPMGVADALKMAGQVARGLLALHAAGFAHGAVEASTVLLTRRGQAKLAGGWTAPAGAAPADDAHALGAALFEALTGRAFAAGLPAPSRLVAGVPPEADELVANVTDPDPATRLQALVVLARLDRATVAV